MMKSFFKKLAFVMALAMVVTTAAPAATTASAASSLRIAYQNGSYGLSEVNITEVGGQEDLKFLGAPSNWKELGAKWTSNNEAVATVDKAGVVTAVSAGTAEIAVQIGAEIAVVKVNCVNTETYTATIGVAAERSITEKTIEEGDTFDFAFYGIKDFDPQRYFCTWASDDTTVATVDEKGLVTAVKPGTAKITLIVFNKVTGKVHNVTPCVVTVPGEAEITEAPAETVAEIEVRQTTAREIVVTFSEEQSYTFEDFTVTEYFDDIAVNAQINEKRFTAGTGTEVTIYMNELFDDGGVYEVSFKDTSYTFTASVGEVTDVKFSYYTKADNCDYVYGVAYIDSDEDNNTVVLYPVFYDANGVNVTDAVEADDFSIDYTADDSDKYSIGYDEIVFDAVTAVTVKMETQWFDEDGEEHNCEYAGTIVSSKRPALKTTYVDGAVFFNNSVAADQAYSAAKGTYTDDFKYIAWGYAWSNGKGTTEIVLGDDNNPTFVARVSDNKEPSVTWTTLAYNSDDADRGVFTYESSNENVFEIETYDGVITPKKVGTASVLVYFTENGTDTPVLVNQTKITVKAERYPATVEIDNTQLKIANDGLDTSATVTITVKDQYGSKIDLENEVTDIEVEANSTKNTTVLSAYRYSTGVYKISFDASNFDAVTSSSTSWSYSIAFDKDENPKLNKSKLSFTVRIYNVDDAMDDLADKTDINYTVQYGANYWWNTVDVKVNQGVVNFKNASSYNWTLPHAEKTLTINAYYVDKNGFRLAEVENLVALTDGQNTGTPGTVYYKITEPSLKKDEVDDYASYTATGNAITWTFNTVSGTALNYAKEGTYKVALYTTRSESNDTIKKLGDYNVTVTNSQPEVSYTGYTDNYAKWNNSHYWNYDNIETAVDAIGTKYVSGNDSNIITAIYDCLGFWYTPEVENWNYNQANNNWNSSQQAKIVSYTAKKVSRSEKLAIQDVTFEITIPGTSYTITQTVKVNAVISK